MMKWLPELIVVELHSRVFSAQTIQKNLFVWATFPFAQMVHGLTTVSLFFQVGCVSNCIFFEDRGQTKLRLAVLIN